MVIIEHLFNHIFSKSESPVINELADKNESLGKAYIEQRVYLAEVEVTGYLEERESSGVPMEWVKIEEIKQISPIKLITIEEKPYAK